MGKLYGNFFSWNSRKVQWALAELDTPYEFVAVDLMKGEQKGPDFLKLNPNGRVPVWQDGDFVLYESNAILLHLGGKLIPTQPQGLALVSQWLFWEANDLASCVQPAWMMKFLDKMSHVALDAARHGELVKRAEHALGILDAHLAGNEYIVDTFSIADIALAEQVGITQEAGIDTKSLTHVASWMQKLQGRDAYGATRPPAT